MGQSTDAILVYGIDLGSEDEPPEFMNSFDDFDEFIQREAGLVYPENGSDQEREEYFTKAREARNNCPVELVCHCSGDYPMYILAPRGCHITASRGYPEEISNLNQITPSEKLMKQFKQWCLLYSVEWSEPKYYLVSYWG